MRDDPDLTHLRSDLANLEGQLSVLAYPERIEDPDSHNARIAGLQESRREVQRELLTLLNLDPERASTDGAELSRLLPEQSAVLDFHVHRPCSGFIGGSESKDPRVLCFVTVADAGEPVLVDLGDAEELRDATHAWLDEITHGQRGRRPDMAEAGPSAAERIRRALFDPIRAVLPADTTRLFVIPDDFIGEVPFGAIPLGDAHYVLEAVDVVYATDPVTLRDLLESTPQPTAASPSILAIGGVDYSRRDKVPEQIDPSTLARAELRRGASTFARAWDPLPNTSEEAEGLAARARTMWPDAADPSVLKGIAATEEAVKVQAPGRTILHFATHGFFQREGLVSLWHAALERADDHPEPRGFGAFDSPGGRNHMDPFAGMPALEGEEPGLLTGLILAGANLGDSLRDESEPGDSDQSDRDDGILTATEVSSLDLSACRLAVLSACQSSLGSGQSGEGLQSLRRGFHEAGADSVIASLWKVDDAATQRLMHAFYDELWTNGCGAGDALRRARLTLLREKKDPYYWGAFTLSGEWR